MAKMTAFNRYQFYADRAAKHERKGEFEKAIEHWEIATLSARGENVQWAESRKAFCERMIKRPFKGK